MIGMNAVSGRSISDEADHIRQSIRNILTTPIGSRIMRRDYGSLIPELIDAPANPSNMLRVMAATVIAIIKWEPRVSVQGVRVLITTDGATTIDLDAVRRDGPRAGSALTLAIPLR